MRIDRLITTGLIDPVLRAFTRQPAADERILPILMYHSISDDPEANVHPYFKVCTSPRRFAEHLQWLAEAGYRGVALNEGLAWLNANKNPATNPQDLTEKSNPQNSVLSVTSCKSAEKLVAITFDDGFRDFHTAAFPALQRHGFSATMYLPTAFIGDDRKTFKARECLTWNEVRELQQAGMEFGSHTVNHPRIVQLQWPAIETELRNSRVEIEQRLGLSVPSFAYPYGFPQAETAFVKRFRVLLQQAGYESCVTTTIGRACPKSDPLNLLRLPANSADDRALFAAKLRGSYDWLATPQIVTKHLSRLLRPASRPVALHNPTPS